MKLPFSILKQSINSSEPPNQKRTIIPSLITIKPSKNLPSYLFPLHVPPSQNSMFKLIDYNINPTTPQ